MGFNPYFESIKVITENNDIKVTESNGIRYILEDVNSPVTRKYHEKMFKSIIEKKHINFGDIPLSKGNIRDYSGYPAMVDTLNTILKLARESEVITVEKYVLIVQEAIRNIEELSSSYQKGFITKTEYVAMEYNTYVYFCVEATTAILYSFVDYIKTPDQTKIKIVIKNTKMRADEFYFDQLLKFNKSQENIGVEYRKMLEQLCNKDKNNFIGTSTAIGMSAVMVAAIAIVPITREVLYQIYNFRGKLSESLDLQVQFLEMNKACVEANSGILENKKSKILQKQEKLAKSIKKLSDIIRVKSAKSIVDSKRELEKDNKMMSIDSLKNDVSNSPFELL